jgi:hypothetical protein
MMKRLHEMSEEEFRDELLYLLTVLKTAKEAGVQAGTGLIADRVNSMMAILGSQARAASILKALQEGTKKVGKR